MGQASFALSIKQPWAALLVHGYKSVEVRRWPTDRRGRILIHAARQSDPRPEAWSHVPDNLNRAARLVGGIIGAAELIDCLAYESQQAFADDTDRHLNDPRWFVNPALYGFVFSNMMPLPFRAYRGSVRFFRVYRKQTPRPRKSEKGQKELY